MSNVTTAQTGTEVRVTGVKATTIAAFESTLFGLIGLVTAIVYSFGALIDYAVETDSVLRGLTFGIAQGILVIILLPIIYAVVGWVIGLIHGWLFNAVAKSSGGIVLETKNAKQ